jgi:hypothetical protein
VVVWIWVCVCLCRPHFLEGNREEEEANDHLPKCSCNASGMTLHVESCPACGRQRCAACDGMPFFLSYDSTFVIWRELRTWFMRIASINHPSRLSSITARHISRFHRANVIDSSQADQITGLSHGIPAVNGLPHLEKTSFGGILFYSLICIISLVDYSLNQLQARRRVLLAGGLLQVSGSRIQSSHILGR